MLSTTKIMLFALVADVWPEFTTSSGEKNEKLLNATEMEGASRRRRQPP